MKKLINWLKINLANFVTLFGLVAAIWLLVIAAKSPDHPRLILALAVAIGLTDFFDGMIAKCLKIESKFGSAIDRLRDKVFICPLLIILIWRHHKSSLTVALVLSLILIEILLLIAWFIGLIKKLDVSSNRYGRIKMFTEFLVVVFWLFSLATKRSFAYLIDAGLLGATFFAIRSLEQYYKKYTKKK